MIGAQAPKYSSYRQRFITRDEFTIVMYVMAVLGAFRYWILWMLKRYTVTLHHVITVYDNMFHPRDGIMGAFALKMAQKEEILILFHKVCIQEAVQLLC
jgi:hypothetical protein